MSKPLQSKKPHQTPQCNIKTPMLRWAFQKVQQRGIVKRTRTNPINKRLAKSRVAQKLFFSKTGLSRWSASLHLFNLCHETARVDSNLLGTWDSALWISAPLDNFVDYLRKQVL